ncbi:cancer/testis antigen family 47 member C1-like, partial [Talpa occidentalis]
MALVPSPGSWSSEDSDFGPAEEEQLPQGLDAVVDSYHFPMAGFRFMFLDMVHSLLYRIYYNDHVLIRTRGGRLMVRPRPRTPEASQPLPALQAPE